MNHSAQESTYPAAVSHAALKTGEQSEASQALNDGRATKKPSLMNTFPGIVALLSVLLSLSFVVLILSALAGLQLGNTLLHHSPFTAYEALWPGQSIESLSAYARHTARGYLPCITGVTPPQDYPGLNVQVAAGAYNAVGQIIKCADYPKDDVFHALSVTIADNQIQQLEFYSDVLPEDALLLYWGMPDSITQSGNPQIVNLYWDRSTYSTMASVTKSVSVVKLLTLIARASDYSR